MSGTPGRVQHSSDELPGLLSGELPPRVAAQVTEHLHACDACRRDLVMAAATTGLLRDAHRLEPFREPVPTMEVGARAARGAGRRRAWRAGTAAAACVVLLVAGAIAVDQPWRGDRASIALAPVGGTALAARGTALMSGTGDRQHMVVRVQDLVPHSGHYYEVWLLHLGDERALAVGVLPDSGTGEYNLPAAVVADYDSVDISAEPADGNPGHSSVSVARGRL